MHSTLIRRLHPEEINKVMGLIEECCEEMGYPFDFTSVFINMLQHVKAGYVVVAEEEGKILGIGGLTFVPHLCNYNKLQAVEFVWHSRPSLKGVPGKRREIMIEILCSMVAEADRVGADLVVSTSIMKSGRIGEYLTREGFVPTEVTYRRERKKNGD